MPRPRLAPLVCAALAACAGCRALYTRTFSPNVLPRRGGLAAQTVPEVLALPEDEIDIGRAALLVAREDRPELDLAVYLRRLDEIAARLRRRLPEGVPAGEAVHETVAALQPAATVGAGWQSVGLPEDGRRGRSRASRRAAMFGSPVRTSEIPEKGLPPQLDLARILDGAKGNCLGLTILYLAVAERVGLPLWGVSAPEHFFVRYDDGVTRINIEPTRGGKILRDRTYIKGSDISHDSLDRGIYLRSESKRQVIASLLANRAGYRAMQGELQGASIDSARALAVKPYWPQGYVNRGLVHELAGRAREAESDYRYALKLDPHCVGALNNLAALYSRGRAVGSGRPAESLLPRATVRETQQHQAVPMPKIGTDESGELAGGADLARRGGLASGSLETAEWMIRRAMRLAPGRPELYETAAAVAAARGRLREARARLRRASTLDPDNTRYVRALETLDL
jgi:regulator of sirC expression with transglutaminase-like and TPR domain